MISAGFALASLLLACLCIAAVYALISGQRPGRFGRELLVGFGLMVGGILVLAGVIELLPVIFGGA